MRDIPTMDDFWNLLIPGAVGWPTATAAILDLGLIADELSVDDRDWLWATATQVVTADDRAAAMAEFERTAPGPFGRMLRALYTIYYTTPAVHAVIERLADSGPHDTSDLFDETLLRQVILTQAGKWRI